MPAKNASDSIRVECQRMEPCRGTLGARAGRMAEGDPTQNGCAKSGSSRQKYLKGKKGSNSGHIHIYSIYPQKQHSNGHGDMPKGLTE